METEHLGPIELEHCELHLYHNQHIRDFYISNNRVMVHVKPLTHPPSIIKPKSNFLKPTFKAVQLDERWKLGPLTNMAQVWFLALPPVYCQVILLSVLPNQVYCTNSAAVNIQPTRKKKEPTGLFPNCLNECSLLFHKRCFVLRIISVSKMEDGFK